MQARGAKTRGPGTWHFPGQDLNVPQQHHVPHCEARLTPVNKSS